MNPLPDEVRELLAAIAAALDLPLPANYLGDESKYRQLMESRVSVVRSSVRGLLAEGDPDMRFDAAFIRKGIERNPVTYPEYEATVPAGKDTGDADQADAGESTEPTACGRCHRPFNAHDPRWDGQARYAATPWCRKCIDSCHEAGADHRCVICE